MGNYLSNTSSNTSSKKVPLTGSVRPPDTMPSGEADGTSNTYTYNVCRPCTKTPEEEHLAGCTDPNNCMCLIQY